MVKGKGKQKGGKKYDQHKTNLPTWWPRWTFTWPILIDHKSSHKLGALAALGKTKKPYRVVFSGGGKVLQSFEFLISKLLCSLRPMARRSVEEPLRTVPLINCTTCLLNCTYHFAPSLAPRWDRQVREINSNPVILIIQYCQNDKNLETPRASYNCLIC